MAFAAEPRRAVRRAVMRFTLIGLAVLVSVAVRLGFRRPSRLVVARAFGVRLPIPLAGVMRGCATHVTAVGGRFGLADEDIALLHLRHAGRERFGDVGVDLELGLFIENADRADGAFRYPALTANFRDQPL